MMNKEKKQNYIKEMSTQFDKSEAVIVAHYQGLTVKQLDDLRKQMRKHGIIFKVTKNRITKLALEGTKYKKLENLFTGPTAVAFSEDAITSAKILTKFSVCLTDNFFSIILAATKLALSNPTKILAWPAVSFLSSSCFKTSEGKFNNLKELVI